MNGWQTPNERAAQLAINERMAYQAALERARYPNGRRVATHSDHGLVGPALGVVLALFIIGCALIKILFAILL